MINSNGDFAEIFIYLPALFVFMPDLQLPRITLRYNGIFDFNGFYVAVTDCSKNYGYMWHEVDYKHKVPSAEGAEQELKWLLTKK